jgi:hypothetical protein
MKGLTHDELVEWNPPVQPYIIEKNILVPGSKMFMFGKAGSWKSMLSLHTAYSISTGTNWFGYRTVKTPCYILQTEVPKLQLRDRVVKYSVGNQIKSNGVWLTYEPYIKLDKGFGISELDKELSRTGARLLIIDPIYKVVSGKLSDEWDMRQFMDRMDMEIGSKNLTLIILHHPRKTLLADGVAIDMGGEDMFGSYFFNWCDTCIKVQTTDRDGEVDLIFEKLRHAYELVPNMTIQIDRPTLKFRLLNKWYNKGVSADEANSGGYG